MNEPQDNELLAYLKKINTSIEPYSKPIAVIVAVLIIGGIGYGLYSSKVSGDRSDATLSLLAALGKGDPTALEKISADYPGTPAAAWSHLFEANQQMSNGLMSLYQDREEATTYLDDAKSAFRMALQTSDNPLLVSRAHYGLARIAESLGDLDEAIDEYKKCAAAKESDEMVEVVEERIASLGKADTKKFLAWFQDQDFSPPSAAAPPSLPPLSTLPDDAGDAGLPPLDDSSDDDADPKPLKEGGLELPTEPATTEGGEAASGKTPASEEAGSATEDAATASKETEGGDTAAADAGTTPEVSEDAAAADSTDQPAEAASGEEAANEGEAAGESESAEEKGN